MQKIECLGHLIEYVLAMPLGQYVFPDEREEVDVHMFEHQVNIPVILCPDDLFQLDDVGMREFHEKHDLSVGTLRIGGIIEGIEVLLKCLDLSGLLVCHLPHVPVGPTADLLVHLEPSKDVSLDFFTH